ncbi:ATP-dependent nuclease subunit B [Streptococcus halichoeri]|uniref:ATP-dependent nuclease subunit B n=1 Tax=Streptococcus halichoeri TaxID=254785 RepID=UPI00135B8183|nr:ATP-dependent nuclease subunit B [Streptococcus halichoeri]
MKLLYTEMHHDLTRLLVKEADAFAKKGYRVFYIAPNSLSFEKERTVLELLPEQASFDIVITRFAQMSRYFLLDQVTESEPVDDSGLTMLFYRALLQLNQEDLPMFYALKEDFGFIEQLVDLFKELRQSHLSISDLILDNPRKTSELSTIFARVTDLMQANALTASSPLSLFAKSILTGQLNDRLAKTVIVIDGFTRFSAEEEALVDLLHRYCQQVIIGAYCSQKAFRASYTKGNVYEASLEFLLKLAGRYQVQPQYLAETDTYPQTFQKLGKAVEAQHDFTETSVDFSAADLSRVALWESINQKEEIEHIAKAIRAKLNQGYRYKDHLVLLGDVETYYQQIGPIFDKYEIPYYLGKAESMTNHPLVQFVESLYRLKKYHWRADDLCHLLKSGLFGGITQPESDQLEYYLNYADLNGLGDFAKPFTKTSYDQQGRATFDLAFLNEIRKKVVQPLQTLLSQRAQSAAALVRQVRDFLVAIQLPQQFQAMSLTKPALEQDKDLEVWKAFTALLEQFFSLFAQEKMTLSHCLAVLRAGMQAATYRVVPATVDVVTIKSYDLIEPHTNKFVYAIGMSRSYFPKPVLNTTLISDQERLASNEHQDALHQMPIPSYDNSQKNHFTAMSLYQSATQELVISFPTLLNDVSQELSPYLKELLALGIPLTTVGKNRFSMEATDIGNFKSLLSSVVAINQGDVTEELNDGERQFWTVMLRYVKRRLEREHFSWPSASKRLQTQPLSPEVLALIFPPEQPLKLSASALTTFYNNQYKYFLQYVLGLHQLETSKAKANNHGTYLHKVFELILSDHSAVPFDQKVAAAIEQANHYRDIATYYQTTAEGRYDFEILKDIIWSTATILEQQTDLQVLEREKHFILPLADHLQISGTIDRLDQLADGQLGVVDYKSSQTNFDIGKFYNGLNSQLVTYLSALQASEQEQAQRPFYGAMYLHMHEPKLELNQFKEIGGKLVEAVYQELTYRGIFMEEAKEHLANGRYYLYNSLYSQAEIELMLTYNQSLFERAKQLITKGHFLINPYTQDGKTVQGDQLKAITGFEADLDLAQARHLVKLPAKNKKEGFLALMQEGESHDEV